MDKFHNASAGPVAKHRVRSAFIRVVDTCKCPRAVSHSISTPVLAIDDNHPETVDADVYQDRTFFMENVF